MEEADLTVKLNENIKFPYSKIYIYTDSSQYYGKNKCGIGFIVVNKRGNIILEFGKQLKNITNNQGELLAIYYSLLFIKDNLSSIKKAVIYSDSLYSVKVLNRKWRYRSNKTLIEMILSEIDYLRKYIRLTICWIKGHNGCPFNSRADQIANIMRCMEVFNELER